MAVFSVGSATIVPLTRRTDMCAEARQSIVFPSFADILVLRWSVGLNKGSPCRHSCTRKGSSTHSMPATPLTRFSAVIVPVLSRQQTAALPAGGVREGSVQKIDYFCNATKLALTAKLSSIDYSGGTILVTIITKSRGSLLFLSPFHP